MKVNINGANHQVEVDVEHTDLGYVIGKVLALWEATRPVDTRMGSGSGFQVIERAPSGDGDG